MMPKKPSKASTTKLRPDVAETAFRVMMEATGQAEKTPPPGAHREPAKKAPAPPAPKKP